MVVQTKIEELCDTEKECPNVKISNNCKQIAKNIM